MAEPRRKGDRTPEKKPAGKKPAGKRPSRTKPARASGEDVVAVAGATEDGGWHVLRKRQDRLEAGVVRPLEEGKPIQGEVVRLRPREEVPFLFDVDVQYDGADASPAEARKGGGPPKVSSDGYRKGWDAIWGGRRSKEGQLN